MPLISGFNRRAKNYLYFRVAVTFGEGGGGGGGRGAFRNSTVCRYDISCLRVICRVAFSNKFLASSNSFLVRMLSLYNSVVFHFLATRRGTAVTLILVSSLRAGKSAGFTHDNLFALQRSWLFSSIYRRAFSISAVKALICGS